MTKQLKVMTILGTRPEIIRLSRVMQLLDQHTEHVLVHTGQNSDYELNEVFFKDLRVKQPKHFLSISRDSLGRILGDVLIKSEEVLRQEKPDAVVILGDTNSSFGAIIARRMKIPVYHMEAGNRCFDFNVPEELNRRIIDHISDFNLVYTEHARRNLLAEGIHPRRIYLTGSPMREVLDDNRKSIEVSDVLDRLELKPQKFFLVSMHRAENVDVEEHLTQLLEAINELGEKYQLPIIVSTHPRTKHRLEKLKFVSSDLVRFLPPFGYHDYVRLQCDAYCTLSDSGTISEESSILGFPAVTMRTAMERPEAMDSGHIVLTGRDPETILRSVQLVVESAASDRQQRIAKEYEVTNTSYRVLKLILGTAKLGHLWDGIVAA
ncbi:non-hydrolyzing UDP-N-acetylglucosamine 2-epimerase [Bythopirellula polymerisocia]|uniref:UDP-2,3-diacetamido-2,3-dideoxy-D-glucuronate 2-epimerase n=1 Tax=Bythopirellula polymerisocia TaxID=2528003 RepID=A0A5C6CMI9_9BACT|nr:UDP-N-acetylglucosamine 2-epimerase (non-hydrolyzing) [Bythopirellula polymerisocia]TWU24684.1 UDP-2,3-diacetamido-2,3-dideoxy-D-glucuronate 2-epimerase [Bythopirellula polymerisocia]